MKQFTSLVAVFALLVTLNASAEESVEISNQVGSSQKLSPSAAAAVAPVSTNMVPESAAGQSTAKLGDVAATGPWSANYLHWITDVGAGSTYNYVKLNYKLSNGVTISAVPVFTFDYNWAAGEVLNGGMLDSYVQFSKAGVISVPGTGGIDLTARIYVPTSAAAQDQGTQGRLYGAMVISQELTPKLSSSFSSLNWYFQQSRENYVSDKGEVKSNMRYVGFHAAELSYAVSDKYSVAGEFQLENNLRINGDRADIFYIDVSATVNLSDALSLQLGISNSRPALDLSQLGGSPQTNTGYIIASGKFL